MLETSSTEAVQNRPILASKRLSPPTTKGCPVKGFMYCERSSDWSMPGTTLWNAAELEYQLVAARDAYCELVTQFIGWFGDSVVYGTRQLE